VSAPPIAGAARLGALAVLAALVALVASAAAHGRPHAEGPLVHVLPGGELFPEGMGYDARSGDFFAGGIGDGSVVRGKIASAQPTVFAPAGADGRAAALAARPDHGRVYVGSPLGKVWVYDEASGRLLARLATGTKGSVLNDFAFLPDGTAFVTDSANPILWRIPPGSGGRPRLERFLDFTGTVFRYVKGFNADGIVAAGGGRYLIVNQLATGKLFRVDVAAKTVTEVRKADGTLLSVIGNRAFRFPTAVAVVASRLLVLDSQLDRYIAKKRPLLPFTVVSVPRR
jgi:Cu-Zn family superoxide dismutase